MASHYLLLQRSLAYQFTSVFSLANGGLVSYALSTYTNQRMLARSFGAELNNSDLNSAGGIIIAAGALVGTLTGLVFLIILFRPSHTESRRSVLLLESSFAICTILMLVALLLSTIITATKSAVLTTTGLSPSQVLAVTNALGDLQYRHNALALATTILTYPTFIGLIVSAYFGSRAARYVEKNGPADVGETMLEREFNKRGGSRIRFGLQ